ncbi:MAG: glycyl-radical enzyme activating protein [Lentisphaeria bacterium]|nr:glycyl-radical enzyme activating protein [Lentisphaeria bacterium]
MSQTALITNIQSMSTHDGPGMRTTIFFKGCPLSCTWCHNPETIAMGQELKWSKKKCIYCGQCGNLCNNESLKSITINPRIFNPEACSTYLDGTSVCPTKSLTTAATEYTVEELVKRIKRDEPFIRQSNGGVTLSGGEATMHADFIKALLKRLKEEGFHTALDTCGMVKTEKLLSLLSYTDLILYDIKEINSEKHFKFTGSDNKLILDNLKKVNDYIIQSDHAIKLWIRTPLVPGQTATSENIRGIGSFISKHLINTVSRWELCCFNNLCTDKYRELGSEWTLINTPLLNTETARNLLSVAKDSGCPKEIVFMTGPTSKD